MNDSEKSIKNQLKKLNRQLKHWSLAYYSGLALVEDAVFDAAYQQLLSLEQLYPHLIEKDSITQKVGSANINTRLFAKHQHTVPMLSLDNCFNDQDLVRFYNHCCKKAPIPIDFILEPKVDGSSISLIYVNRQLQYGISRGDGVMGENITANILKIKTIPKTLPPQAPDHLEVRGEIYMNISDFEVYNAQLGTSFGASQKKLANPRNAVAGALRLKNSDKIVNMPIQIALYQIVDPNNKLQLNSQQQVHDLLRAWNLPTLDSNLIKVVPDLETMQSYIQTFATIKQQMDFPCDGLVIKVNPLSVYDAIGYTKKAPKWSIAYKYPNTVAKTKIIDIFATVGRTGKITYVADLVPVKIMGSTITKVSLHNIEYIQTKDLRINDTVSLYKSGDIIPKIIATDLDLRPSDSTPWTPIEKCPECSSLLVTNQDHVLQFCPNKNCRQKMIAWLTHFCSRSVMNIVGLSDKLIEKLYDKNFLTKPWELYELINYKELIIFQDFKNHTVFFDKIFQEIETSKTTEFEKVLFGLCIPGIGLKTAQDLANYFQNITNLQAASYDDLISSGLVGTITANNLITWFQEPDNLELIQKLQACGLQFSYQSKQALFANHFLANQKVVITGKFELSRLKLTELLKSRFNCQIQTSVTSNTAFLIVGENPSRKLNKATQLGVKIIDQPTMEQIIHETN